MRQGLRVLRVRAMSRCVQSARLLEVPSWARVALCAKWNSSRFDAWVRVCRNPATGNMCSKCSKAEGVTAPAAAAAPTPAVAVPAVGASSPVDVPSPSQAGAAASDPAAASPPVVSASFPPGPTPNPGKCAQCSKKVGILGFPCRCGLVFCGSHRYADAHACTFDYKAAAAAQLTKANPVVAASKLDKVRVTASSADSSERPTASKPRILTHRLMFSLFLQF